MKAESDKAKHGKVVDAAFVEIWQRTRLRGRARYILVEGILRRGILLGVPVAALPFAFGLYTGVSVMTFWQFAAAAAVLSLLFGAGMGALFWHLQEKEYQRSAANRAKG